MDGGSFRRPPRAVVFCSPNSVKGGDADKTIEAGETYRKFVIQHEKALGGKMQGKRVIVIALTLAALVSLLATASVGAAQPPTYDITTLAGKVASLNGTAGL